jgi:hypothetical protein
LPTANSSAPKSADTLGVDAPAFSVGQVLPLPCRPIAEAIRLLTFLVQQETPGTIAEALRDPRIPSAHWPRVLARELATMLGWAARRRMAYAAAGQLAVSAVQPAWSAAGTVLALLPRHGHTVHLMRRALPFTLCGIPVQVSGHDSDRDIITAVLAVLIDLLNLPEINVHPDTARTAVSQMHEDDLVVLTGAPASLPAVRVATSARVLAATGGCVLLVSSDPAALRRAAAVLGRDDQPDSCTRLGGAWLIKPDVAGNRRHGPPIGAMHPSAVYRLTPNLGEPPLSYDCYTCLPCDEHGVVGTLVGFARDPIGGWPGDFLI